MNFIGMNNEFSICYENKNILSCVWAYSQSGHYVFATGFKDFVFAIFQIQNLNGINLNERYWIIQIMIIFMVVVVFHIHM